MKQYYLGIASTVHDPAIAIMDQNGEVLFAEALERHLQHKIAWDISPVGMFVFLSDLLSQYHTKTTQWQVGLSWQFDVKNVMLGNVNQQEISLASAPNPFAIPDEQWGKWLIKMQTNYLSRLHQLLPFTISAVTAQPNIILKSYDHHLTHAASASYFYNGPQPALVVIVDGEGEVGSLSCYCLENCKLRRIGRSWGPGSLGGFYGTVTNLIGFDLRKGEEWKLMGLAAYGSFDDLIYADLKPLVIFKDGRLLPAEDDYRRKILEKYARLTPNLKKNPVQAANIAYVAQYIFEEVMRELVFHYRKKTGLRNLIIGGGCALNSRFNGMISEQDQFDSIFVPPAPGDDGNAIGVAALMHDEATITPSIATRPFTSPYLGNEMKREVLKRFIKEYPKVTSYPDMDTLNADIAGELVSGKLIAWVQNRAEFGPRALGNRSILANPTIPNIKDIINSKIKFREEYRPFAPAIMHEHGENWFEHYRFWPYMSAAISWKPEKCLQIPGVVHSDKTGRVQSVSEQTNPKFYQLIKAFHNLTDIPILLNTSLNVMGKPIVNSVEDAIGIFLTSGLDILVIDKWAFRK